MYYYRIESNGTVVVLDENSNIIKTFLNLEAARKYCKECNIRFSHDYKL